MAALLFVARLLRESLRSWLRVLPWLLVPALLLTLPTIPFEFDDFKADLPPPATLADLRHPWTIFVHLVASLILPGAAALLILARRRGETPTVLPFLLAFGRLLLPLVAAAVVFLSVLLLWILPGVLVGSAYPAGVVLSLFALWPMVVFALATTVVAVERLPPLVAMRRSFELTRGVRSVVLLSLIAAMAAGMLLLYAGEWLAAALPATPLLRFNLGLVTLLVSDTFNAVLVANLYGALRQRQAALVPPAPPAGEPEP
jgi:hypothetical protein